MKVIHNMVHLYCYGGDRLQLKVAICEDDTIICEDAQRQIFDVRPDYVIDTYPTGEELLFNNKEYDIVFLDIEMPGRDGMSVAKELREKNYCGHIIFMTSHTEFMPEAFKVKAFRFLQKPIKMEELMETLVESEKEIFGDKKLIVTDYGVDILLKLSDILYVEARKNKTMIYTLNDVLETNYTLKYWLRELGIADFFQVHKSYIVSLRHIKMFDVDYIVLHGSDAIVPVSRRKASLVKKAFFDYVKANATYM